MARKKNCWTIEVLGIHAGAVGTVKQIAEVDRMTATTYGQLVAMIAQKVNEVLVNAYQPPPSGGEWFEPRILDLRINVERTWANVIR